jgi:hypothetical protein
MEISRPLVMEISRPRLNAKHAKHAKHARIAKHAKKIDLSAFTSRDPRAEGDE